ASTAMPPMPNTQRDIALLLPGAGRPPVLPIGRGRALESRTPTSVGGGGAGAEGPFEPMKVQDLREPGVALEEVVALQQGLLFRRGKAQGVAKGVQEGL